MTTEKNEKTKKAANFRMDYSTDFSTAAGMMTEEGSGERSKSQDYEFGNIGSHGSAEQKKNESQNEMEDKEKYQL